MRRAALIGIAAVATFGLGGAVAACGGEGGKPYVALGAAGPTPTVTGAVPPSGKVELVPLDGSAGTASAGNTPLPGTSEPAPAIGAARRDGGARAPTLPQALEEQGGPPAPGGTHARSGGGSSNSGDGGAGRSGGGTGGGRATGGSTGDGGAGRSGGGGTGGSGRSGGSSGAPSGTPAPAALGVGAITRAPADTRWCDRVTVALRNTGGTPVRSGTLTFATHVIGLLGVDWATLTSTRPLPGPIGAGAAVSPTYTVCVDAWRVPIGMHVETREVTADWR
ncbi:hypothetical protein AB0G73_31355 [Streptomyces sp. NPDC020719]|uniref:hypothetical protein n=1 Tax=unclassified Streptomyces TaxID=2593676 RepID=UPI0033E929C5